MYAITSATNLINFRLLVDMRTSPTLTQPTFTLSNATGASLIALGSNNILFSATVSTNAYARLRCSTDGFISAEL
jgi:hypothetical protein